MPCRGSHSQNSSPALSRRGSEARSPVRSHDGSHSHNHSPSVFRRGSEARSPVRSHDGSHSHNLSPAVFHRGSKARSPVRSHDGSHSHNHSPSVFRRGSEARSPVKSHDGSHSHNHSPSVFRRGSDTLSPVESHDGSHSRNHSPAVFHRGSEARSPVESHDGSHARNHSPAVFHRGSEARSPVKSHDGSHARNHSPAVFHRGSEARSPVKSHDGSHARTHSPAVFRRGSEARSPVKSHDGSHSPSVFRRGSDTLSPVKSHDGSHARNHSPFVSRRGSDTLTPHHRSDTRNPSPAISHHGTHTQNHSPAVLPHSSPSSFASRSQHFTPCSSRNPSQQSRKPLRLRRTSDSPSYSLTPTNTPAQRTLFSRDSNPGASSPGTLPPTEIPQPPPSSPVPHLSRDYSNGAPLLNSPPRTLSLQPAFLEECSASFGSDNAGEGSSSSSEPRHTPSVKLDPPCCSLPRCPTPPALQQYSRAGETYLKSYADTVGQVEGGGNYLSLLEKLLSHGNYIPSSQLKKVLKTVLRLRSSDYVRQACRVLHRDLCIRRETNVPEGCVWHLLESCMKTLQQEGGENSVVSLMAAEVILNYLFGLLVKDFNSKTDNPKSSLIERVLSLSRHWLRVAKVLDFLFSVQERGPPREASDLGEVVHSLVCLPLLTCSRLERRDQATRLARELSERLGKLSSVEKKKHLLLSLPSHYLRELLLDIHLAAHCALSPAISQESCKSRDLSIAIHMNRRPYHHDGRQHEDPSYFLFQLCHLLQSHICNLEGAALLSFLVPSIPSGPLPSDWRARSPCPPLELQKSLVDLRQQVGALTERLTQDTALLSSLTDGENWLYLQLLGALTTPLDL